jgi:NAD(P)-dependent dehydrogenase (short-subunit alcohol dehydrogenase family)
MTCALVTGAGKRLGRAMALALAEAGHDVAIHYAGSEDAAEETAAAIREKGRRAVMLQADLTVEAEMQALIPAAAEALGAPLTVLVRTAGRAGWDRHFESNLRAPFVLIQNFAAQAPEAETDEAGEPRARALAVNMIDQRVRKLTPEFMTYTLAKSALWTLTRTAAQGLAPHVRVNAIGPGPTLIGARQSERHFAKQRESTVLERGSNPSDITGALLYFLNAPAVTGQLLCTDGGQHLGWQTPDVQGVE